MYSSNYRLSPEVRDTIEDMNTRDNPYYLVGCAVGSMASGRGDDMKQAGRNVGQAYRLFLRAGLQPQQAIDRIRSLAETFGALE